MRLALVPGLSFALPASRAFARTRAEFFDLTDPDPPGPPQIAPASRSDGRPVV